MDENWFRVQPRGERLLLLREHLCAQSLVWLFAREKRPKTSVQEIAALSGAEVGARIIVVFIAFIPMFAIWEISKLFMESQLFELFFEHRGPVGGELSVRTAATLP